MFWAAGRGCVKGVRRGANHGCDSAEHGDNTNNRQMEDIGHVSKEEC